MTEPVTQFTSTKELEERLKELQAKWRLDIKSKYSAGGNSETNYERIQIGIELEKRKKIDG